LLVGLVLGAIISGWATPTQSGSMHLKCLGECGLVRWQRDGRFVHYEIADKRVLKLLDQGEELLLHVGPLIAACPRYRQAGRASRRPAGLRRRP
jgi:hypothetical protein